MLIITQGADANFTISYVNNLHRIASLREGNGGPEHCELDLHANTCVAGCNVLEIAHNNGWTITVSPYRSEYKPRKGVCFALIAFLWEDPETYKGYNLIMHEALYFGDKLEHSLLNPNQIWDQDICVDDVPRQFDKKSLHSIYIPSSDLTIPLSLRGIISGFECQKPSWEEYLLLPKVELMSSQPWSPSSNSFEKREHKVAPIFMLNRHQGILLQPNCEHQIAAARAVYCSTTLMMPHKEDNMAALLIPQVTVATEDMDGNRRTGRWDELIFPPNEEHKRIMALSTTEKRSALAPEILSRRWGIKLETRKKNAIYSIGDPDLP